MIVEHRADGAVVSEATVKLTAKGERIVATGEGNGPVNALDNALRLALERLYPELAMLELADYKVRILESSHGTGAVTRVLIDSGDGTGAPDDLEHGRGGREHHRRVLARAGGGRHLRPDAGRLPADRGGQRGLSPSRCPGVAPATLSFRRVVVMSESAMHYGLFRHEPPTGYAGRKGEGAAMRRIGTGACRGLTAAELYPGPLALGPPVRITVTTPVRVCGIPRILPFLPARPAATALPVTRAALTALTAAPRDRGQPRRICLRHRQRLPVPLRFQRSLPGAQGHLLQGDGR